MRNRLRWMLLALAAPWLPCGAVSAADTVVVCPPALRAALQGWLDYRASQGHQIVLVAPEDSARAIQQRIRDIARQHELKHVVLIGDVPSAANAAKHTSVPTFLVPAKVNVLLGGEQEIATDNAYGDLDGDDVPELAVGRLSVTAPEELAVVVAKITAYEAEAGGAWRRRVQFVAGVGGFGAVSDAALEAVARKFITDGVPPEFASTMTYANWRSPFCPDPRQFRAACCARLDEGALFFVYIGHGSPRGLDHVQTPDGRSFPILQQSDVPRLKCPQGTPIAVLLACSTCAFDGPRDCLAEDLLRCPGGPVAVIGGSRVTMPYGMGVLATHMLRNVFQKRLPTVGEVFVQAKRAAITAPRDDAESKALDFLAGTLGIHNDLEAERREHLHLFHILGDPLLRVPLPQALELSAPSVVAPDGRLRVRGQAPFAGTCHVELVVRRDRLRFAPPQRLAYRGDDNALAEYQALYEQANDPVLAETERTVPPGPFAIELAVPPEAKGACHVRVLLLGDRRAAAGAQSVQVLPSRASQAP